ncbi:formate dehydrogenase subunit gamma [Sulfitobacter guttiformis]|uniref:Formate dehydrogenase gamma subunit n=1 Tax=Sulfitobacter guttiformis TaxID=74349 RepID=A0A420DJ69_9RHOB|nr:formate dehydrogenase subunit gamma [Sulfitobacter guttiformis]KIN71954.1 Formate dehydrogenase, gamma subunit [Sulfitobacter guttiformis KCTC 32187]RKE94245.1 formate dehydrogenase gamma subunit [Sulfitobacter guttiformis]
MKNLSQRLSAFIAVLTLLAFSGIAAPTTAQAQQVNPTEQSVTEEQLFNTLKDEEAVSGRVSIPDKQAAGLIKPGNKSWAGTHNGLVRTLTIVAILGAVIGLALFYMIRGRIRIDGKFSGMRILRFSAIERFAHWLMSGSFVVLALTGLNLVFGRIIILPWLGEGAFSTLTHWGKVSHNYVGWAFMLGLALAFVFWVAHNIPEKLDVEWLKQGGGLFKKGVHPPAKKFNAGQKIIFWSTMAGGAILSLTGLLLLFPGVQILGLGAEQADWHFYQLVHGLVAAGLTFIIIAHIYIGSIGMEGAFDAMGKGDVDLNWAKEHHSLWVDEVQANQIEKITPAKGTQPAE